MRRIRKTQTRCLNYLSSLSGGQRWSGGQRNGQRPMTVCPEDICKLHQTYPTQSTGLYPVGCAGADLSAVDAYGRSRLAPTTLSLERTENAKTTPKTTLRRLRFTVKFDTIYTWITNSFQNELCPSAPNSSDVSSGVIARSFSVLLWLLN